MLLRPPSQSTPVVTVYIKTSPSRTQTMGDTGRRSRSRRKTRMRKIRRTRRNRRSRNR